MRAPAQSRANGAPPDGAPRGARCAPSRSVPLGARVGLGALLALLGLYTFQLLAAPLEDPLATQVEGLLTNVTMLGAGALLAVRSSPSGTAGRLRRGPSHSA